VETFLLDVLARRRVQSLLIWKFRFLSRDQ